MSSSYFQVLPKIRYFGTIVTNLTARAEFVERLKQVASIYYPYVVRDGETADTIASWYYGDSSFDWLIYMTNNIVDPYTQWPKPDQMFNDYIIKKYGSIEIAKSTILFYRKKPEISYISPDNISYSNAMQNNYDASYNYTDIRITPETHATLDDPNDYLAIYAYDYEVEENDNRRNITLIDNAIANKIYNDLRDIMKNV